MRARAATWCSSATPGHPEVEGTMGRFDTAHGGHMHLIENVEQAAKLDVRDPEKLAFVTQTTLSVDDTAAIVNALRERFPTLASPRREDICYATQNRQDAVKELIANCDVLHRGGLDHQFQFKPAARARRTRRPARLSHRRRVVPASASGSRARTPSASPPAPRRPKSWCSRWWRDCASGAAPRRRSSWGAKNTWCSHCRVAIARGHQPSGTPLVPAVRAAILAAGIDRKSPAILVDAQLHTARILRLISARDHARGGPVTQIVFAVAHRDRVVAKPRTSG